MRPTTECCVSAAAGHSPNRNDLSLSAPHGGGERAEDRRDRLAGQQHGRTAAELRVLRQDKRPGLCASQPGDTAQLLCRSQAVVRSSLSQGLHRGGAEPVRQRQAAFSHRLVGPGWLRGKYY